MSTPVLWQFTASHFNEKARWALDFKGVPHVRRSLLPGLHAFKIRPMTGQTAVPVLQLNGHAIHDSTRIIEALEAAHPEPPLYPQGERERRRALELEDFFDEELGPHIRRAGFYHLLQRPDLVVAMFSQQSGPAARAAFRLCFPLLRALMRKAMRIDIAGADLSQRKTIAALDRLEAELGPSGYLAGERFSVADLTGAALFSPIVRPPEFPYPFPPMPPALAEIRESFAARRGFQWVIEMYRRHRGSSTEVSA